MRPIVAFVRAKEVKTLLRVLALCSFILSVSSGSLYAQAVGGGQIQGTITDETGSAVAGATVEAVQTESDPGTALSASTFGTITAANPPRILQLSLKMDF